jgi:hypothetical protein
VRGVLHDLAFAEMDDEATHVGVLDEVRHRRVRLDLDEDARVRRESERARAADRRRAAERERGMRLLVLEFVERRGEDAALDRRDEMDLVAAGRRDERVLQLGVALVERRRFVEVPRERLGGASRRHAHRAEEAAGVGKRHDRGFAAQSATVEQRRRHVQRQRLAVVAFEVRRLDRERRPVGPSQLHGDRRALDHVDAPDVVRLVHGRTTGGILSTRTPRGKPPDDSVRSRAPSGTS